ncbi:Cyclic di-GMP phosphodiesterase Gmr [Anaerotruncus sp. 2789STDY5834896]|uniref:Cyclic di-GMP phosphodiesterase Gmr n=1 Tax=uncultured Anaerotruncus sp. TaxID=905011 RepID=A0A1C6HBR6_9FIRM|nr:Cyclic di-GMP phosphodiesterase Gmr [uncultured Anaerotruncus sp.]
MQREQIAALIADESENMAYVADPSTYELLYVNKAVVHDFGLCGDAYLGQPCYRVLQGLETPCPFCTNHLLTTEKYLYWKHYNPILKQYYLLRDKLFKLPGGRLVRLEICTDITDSENTNLHLQNQLTTEETLLRCVHTLSGEDDTDTAINKLLSIIGGYYQADRAYLFEVDPGGQMISNSYEWCQEQVQPQIENLQQIPITAIDRWMEYFTTQGEFFLTSAGKTLQPDSIEYQILAPQKIDSLMAAPLWEGETLSGFIGVDNPAANTGETHLLKSITYFIKEDIQKRHLLEQLKELSYTDGLTGLGNRHQYISFLAGLDKAPPRSMGVVFIDINGLKVANDSFGHQYGDEMIRSVGHGLREIFPEHTFRIGGDEFVGLLIDAEREEFDRRVEALRRYEAKDSLAGFSIGVNWSAGQVHPSQQISYSDNLMYVEKQAYYNSSTHRIRHPRRGVLSQELKKALAAGEFMVYLQPKFDLVTGAMAGAEALVRRRGSGGSVIPPDRFIPLYEAGGVIRHVDFFVLRTVCKWLKEWREKGCAPEQIAVNFSRITLMEHGVEEKMKSILQRYGIAPGQIIVEVTESTGKMDGVSLGDIAQQIKGAGFSLSLDDFGSQYSNLSVLTAAGFDEIKFDRSLVEEIGQQPQATVVAKHGISLCQDLGTTPVAEGIETVQQLLLLRTYGCKLGQGFHFAHPMPGEEFYQRYLANKQ